MKRLLFFALLFAVNVSGQDVTSMTFNAWGESAGGNYQGGNNSYVTTPKKSEFYARQAGDNAGSGYVGIALVEAGSPSQSPSIPSGLWGTGFWYMQDTTGYDGGGSSFYVDNLSDGVDWTIIANSSSEYVVRNDIGTRIDSFSNPFTKDTWYYINIIYDKHATTGSLKFFVDGVEKISVTGQDFDNGTAVSAGFHWFKVQAPAANKVVWVDEQYAMGGMTDENDFLNFGKVGYEPEILVGKSDVASATDQGTTLDAGQWDGLSTIPRPLSFSVQYTGGVSSGSTIFDSGSYNPINGDSRIDGTVYAAKYHWVAKRGGGGSTIFDFLWGNSGASLQSFTRALDTSPTASSQFTNDAAIFGSSSDNLEIGFAKDGGGQDLKVDAAISVVLHAPLVPAPEETFDKRILQLIQTY